MREPTPDIIPDVLARSRPLLPPEPCPAPHLSGMEPRPDTLLSGQYLDVFHREAKPKSASWAIWWSDLMMTMFIMFAALYAFQIPVSRAVPVPSGEPVPTAVRSAADETGSILIRVHDQIRDIIRREGPADSVFMRLTPGKSLRVILMGDVFFTSGSHVLRPSGRAALQQISPVLRGAPHLLAVVGHAATGESTADGSGAWAVSTARSGEVADFLMENGGIDPGRISLAAYGDQRPLWRDAAADARNRRVELVLSMENPTEPPVEVASGGNGFRNWVAREGSALAE